MMLCLFRPARSQALKKERGEHLWQFLPASCYRLIAKQLDRQQAEERTGHGSCGERNINLAQLSLLALHGKIAFSYLECWQNHLPVIQVAQFFIDQYLRQHGPEDFSVGPQQGHALAQVGSEEAFHLLLAALYKLLLALHRFVEAMKDGKQHLCLTWKVRINCPISDTCCTRNIFDRRTVEAFFGKNPRGRVKYLIAPRRNNKFLNGIMRGMPTYTTWGLEFNQSSLYLVDRACIELEQD